MKWQPIETAPKDGAMIHARDEDGWDRVTWREDDAWWYAGWRETEDRQEYQSDECWQPVEWAVPCES